MNTAIQTTATATPPVRPALARRARAFGRDEDGSLIIFGVFMFCLMLVIGGLSFDLMRYESQRSVLQNTSDRAALAAASLTQSLDPEAVVWDYFRKAGLEKYLDKVTITEVGGARRVEIDSVLNIPLHFGHFEVFGPAAADGTNTLVVNARSVAMEAIGDVEISMVLDVSGSMGYYNRLENLKTASENFIDTVYETSEAGTVSTSIVPYSEQVSAGPTLLSHYTMDASAHNNSFCVNFQASDFNSTALSTTTPHEQTLHFDPWSSTNYWDLDANNDGQDVDPVALQSPVCRPQTSRRIMAWENDPAVLKAHVNSFYAGGNTSTDIGLKWGSALLDPGTQGVVDAMIASGDVDAELSGRPDSFAEGGTMKIIVVMSDGENTYQHYMTEPFRTGLSNVFAWTDTNGDQYFSVWAGTGAPQFDPQNVCIDWDNGECVRWRTPKYWYRINQYTKSETPYGGAEARQMTWSEVWATIPKRHFVDYILYYAGNQSTLRNEINAASKRHEGSTKNSRMAAICSAAKAQGIIIFAVALETNNSAAGRLQNCASTPAHFYRVRGSEINFAFQAIASQINQLRLLH